MNTGNLLTMSDAQLKAWAASLSLAERQAALRALIAPMPDSLNDETATKAAGPQAVKEAKQTRPLNSFIAYRCESLLPKTYLDDPDRVKLTTRQSLPSTCKKTSLD